MDETKLLIAENLKRVCVLKGIRQKDISKQLGVSSATVSMWLSGVNSIDLSRFVELCQFLDVSIDQICGLVPLDTALTDNEKYLIDIYRALDDIERGNVSSYAQFLRERR